LAACKLTLLGGFGLAAEDGKPLSLPTRKDRLLLAYLALASGRPVTRERLAGLLWADRAEAQARDSLKQSLAALRQALRQAGVDPLRSDRETVVLELDRLEVDAIAFAALATGPSGLGRAAQLYRGELLEGLEGLGAEFEAWLAAERMRLADLAVSVVEQLALTATASGVSEEAVALGRRLLPRDPLREPVYRALMRLAIAKGERAEALKLYAACRDALKRDLGIAPDAKTEELYRDILADRPLPVSSQPEPARPSDRAGIAVLPFVNLGGDPTETYFSDGVTEDIITELSRFRSLFVIARHSSFAFRGEAMEVAEIARKLGVQYVVEGSVRKAGNRIRIAVQLIDATNAAHLWAERYDRDLADIFAVQDEVVRTIVATIAGRVEIAGAAVARRKPPESLVAYDYVLRGIEQLNLEGDAHNAEALRLFQKAVETDPHYAVAHAYVALAIWLQWTTNQIPAELDRALASAREAYALDPNDGRVHRILGGIHAHLHHFDRAEFHCERSLALNPNDPLAALFQAGLLRWLGRPKEGIEWVRRAMRLNPYHPNWYWNSLGRILHSAGLYAEALDAYGRISERPSFYHAYVAACHAELGEMEEARAHAKLALEARPDFTVSSWAQRLPYKHEADLQRFLNGFRKAGLPE
jgi:TolB-like protein/Tfp pilus assembly protein PilF